MKLPRHLILALCLLVPSLALAGTISSLTSGGTIQATDDVPVMRSGVTYRVVVGSAATQASSAFQTVDADLTALAGNSTTGFWAYTGAGTGSARTITAGTSIGVTNGAGTAANPTISVDVTGTSADTSPDETADYLLSYDASASANKKVLMDNVHLKESFCVAASDETTALTTGTAKVTFRMPYAFTVTDIRASTTTANTGGTLLTVDVNEAGTTIISTKLTLDASEKTTTTAATPRVISDTSLADDAEMTIDIDAVGSTVAGAGLKVCIIGRQT